MALTARERQLKDMLGSLGLRVQGARPSNGRIAVTVRANNGAEREFKFAQHVDGGGARGLQNEKAMVRRWLTTVTLQTETVVAAALRQAGVVKTGEGDLVGFQFEDAPQPPHSASEPVAAAPAEPVPVLPAEPKEEPVAQTQLKAVPKKPVINKISQTEFYRLCEWLKAKNLQDAETTQVALALEASKALDLTVVDSTVGTALKAIGVTLRSPKALPSSAKLDRTRVIAKELVHLLRELGKEPSPELLAIAG